MALSLATFASKVSLCLFKGTITNHIRGDALLFEQQGDNLVSMAFEVPGINSTPTEAVGKDLGVFIPTARGCACNQGVTEHLMCNAGVVQHVIICRVSMGIWGHCVGATLGGVTSGKFNSKNVLQATTVSADVGKGTLSGTAEGFKASNYSLPMTR